MAYLPRHKYDIEPNGVTDPETRTLCDEAIEVTAGSLHGFVYAPWLEARVTLLIQQWLPGWSCSHSQLTKRDDQSVQSRSWDIVVHKVPPSGWPAASTPPHGYPLLPMELCCAAINVKTNFSPAGIKAATKEPAYGQDERGDSTDVQSQISFLQPEVPLIFFCLTAYGTHDRMDEVAREHGMRAFALARLYDKERDASQRRIFNWVLQTAKDGGIPFQLFKGYLLECAAKWDAHHR